MAKSVCVYVLQYYVIVFTKKVCCFSCGGSIFALSHCPGVFLSTSKKNSIDIFSAPCVRQCVFVCLLSGHPSWVFLLQCFFQLTNSRFPSMGLMDWHIQAPCPHSLAHTRKHRKKQQSAFQLCRSGQPTDGTLFWWSTALYRNNL